MSRSRTGSRELSAMIAVGIVERQPADQHGVDEGEHRGVDADAERQRQRRDEREPFVFDEQADGELKVLPEPMLENPFRAAQLRC